MIPKLGDIWEWKSERWQHTTREYVTNVSVILILTKPIKRGPNWFFQALELDGPASGVVEEWSMYLDPFHNWRKLA